MKFDSQRFKEIMIGLAVGAGFIGGSYYFIRRAITQRRKEKALDNSTNAGSPESYATQLKMAFENDTWFGMGTDEEALMRVFQEIPSKAVWDRVVTAYSTLYRSNLNDDLKNELTSAEYTKVINLKETKKEK